MPEQAADAVQNQLLQTLSASDRLRSEGILCRGYGLLPKYVMLDPALTIEAKAIYAYFCSYAGAGETAFPGYRRILDDLHMSKDSYYKHYKLLVQEGYLTVDRRAGEGSRGFGHNVYTLVSCPNKFRQEAALPAHEPTYARIRTEGLRGAGYGFIPKAVMLDERLSVKAKALYAYYCVFTGAGETARPRKQQLLLHLGISEKPYKKYNRELIDCNYVVVTQRHIDGRLSVNDYTLTDRPDEQAGKNAPSHQIIVCGSGIQQGQFQEVLAVQRGQIQEVENADSSALLGQKQEVQKQEGLLQEGQKQEANNNKSKINKENNNKIHHSEQTDGQSSLHNEKNEECAANSDGVSYFRLLFPQLALKEYSAEEYAMQRKAAAGIRAEGGLPLAWKGDKPLLAAAAQLLCEDETQGVAARYEMFPDGGEQYAAHELFRECLIELLSARSSVRLSGAMVSPEEIFAAVNRHVAILPPDTIDLGALPEQVKAAYCAAAAERPPRSPKAYMKACIWSGLQQQPDHWD